MATTLYAYALGTDLEQVAPRIEETLDALVAERTWTVPDVWVVNQRVTPEEWDLGVNLTLPPTPQKKLAWLDDAVAIAQALAKLRAELRRDFVLGVQQGKKDPVDVARVDQGTLDEGVLRDALTRAVR